MDSKRVVLCLLISHYVSLCVASRCVLQDGRVNVTCMEQLQKSGDRDDATKDVFENIFVKPPVNLCKPTFAECSSKEKYRRIDGSCNNLKRPNWGMAMSFYKRMHSPVYGDGLTSPRKSNEKGNLPNARLLSTKLFLGRNVVDPSRNLLSAYWGQFIANDLSSPVKLSRNVDCCADDRKDKSCYPIIYLFADPVANETKLKCQNYVRTETDSMQGCAEDELKPAQQINAVTSFLDLSNIYGSDFKTSISLRAMKGGRLLVQEINGTTFLPIDNSSKSCACNRHGEKICYKSGDSRVNDNPYLTLLHTLFVREHNRLADELAYFNPNWTDEKLFQEARHINIGQYQNIVYYEWLPDVLGWKNLISTDIILPNVRGYVNDYIPKIKPTILNEYVAVASKYMHSQISGRIQLKNNFDSVNTTTAYSQWIKRQLLTNKDIFKQMTYGIISQKAEMNDKYIDSDITNKPLYCAGKTLLNDVKAAEIHKDRDHGLGYYNDYRRICNIKKAMSFDDYRDTIPEKIVNLLKTYYRNYKDVDLSVGGALESHWNGATVGPTYLCILLQQFKHIRMSDRFFYEHDTSGFNIEQLLQIRKGSISSIICDNGDDIHGVQLNSFSDLPEELIIPCEMIPRMNLIKWKEIINKKK